jgi:AraC-like DNA-binding protein
MLATRLGTQSPEVAPLLEDVAQRELALVTSLELAPRIEEALRRALQRGDETTAQSIASQLGMSVRTLQRRLVEEGTSFRAARDRARCERARERLAERDVAIATVADELGFADVAAFSKAFRRWTGAPPSLARRGRAQAGPVPVRP